MMFDGTHLRKRLEDLVGQLARCSEADPFGGRCLLAELRGRAESDDLAVVDERHPITEPFGLLHEVGDEEDRDPAVAHAFDQFPRLAPRRRIEARRQLVQDRDLEADR